MSSLKSESRIHPKAKSNENAERLKAQGNTFHVQGQHKAAYKKYTEAIKEDPSNAVLWANRAASCLAMKEYLDAARDAEQAIQLDPKYAKAWGRLATARMALSVWDPCITAWEKALSSLPPEEEKKPEHEALKTQFDEGLKKAKEANAAQQSAAEKNIRVMSIDQARNDLPWMRALAMEKELLAKQHLLSSAFVIMNAYRDFSEGVKIMKSLTVTQVDDKNVINGGNALSDLSNGVLRDKRVFHVDSADWIEKYTYQLEMECGSTGAWHGGAKLVQKEAPQRLKTSGWTPVRRALASTVRYWIMRGFYQGSMGDHVAGIEFLRRALDVLEWGLSKWKDVPTSDRGVIFELSFIRGVRRLYLDELMNGFVAKGDEIGYSIEEIAEIARQMMAETDSNPPSTTTLGMIDSGFYGSHWLYPKADALSILGWYHMTLGLSSEEEMEKQVLLGQAAKYYTEAADTYFKDDEHHVYFLKIALEAHWWRGDPLSTTLPLCARIRSAIPDMKKIWEMYMDKMEKEYQSVLDFETECRQAIEEGKTTLDDCGRPEYMGNTMNARCSAREHLKRSAV